MFFSIVGVNASTPFKTYDVGEAVYYNAVEGKACTLEEYNKSVNASKSGNTEDCMKWYAIYDTD